jgi:hypothetical protein
MQPMYRLAMAMVVAVAALLAPAAQADSGKGIIPVIIPPSVTYTYVDDEGMGTMEVLYRDPLPALPSVQPIEVRITQNGQILQGTGTAIQLFSGTKHIAASLHLLGSPFGFTYSYSGTITDTGTTASGTGFYTLAGYMGVHSWIVYE